MFFPFPAFAASLIAAAVLATAVADEAECPPKCFCNAFNKMVYCSKKGLTVIPAGIPSDTKQLNLAGNQFSSPRLQRSNLTGLARVEHIYLSECGIEEVDVGTFIELVSLSWLDLSNNRIKHIPDFAFNGLHLQHLFISGNRNLGLRANSFAGLATNGLYLHDCSMRRFSSDVLTPLNSSLRSLWLNGNELKRLEKRFLPIFSSLQHLRLGSNPLHCNCEMVWLKEFFDANAERFKGASPPSCLSPQKLKARFFNNITLLDFKCSPPSFRNIDAVFPGAHGRLRCSAAGDPAPTLFWIQPSGESRRYEPARGDEVRFNEAALRVTPHSSRDLSGMYICVANNDAGNATFTLNISFPKHETRRVVPEYVPATETRFRLRPTVAAITTPRPYLSDDGRFHMTNAVQEPDSEQVLTHADSSAAHRAKRCFSLSELIGAALGSFVGAWLIALVCLPIVLRRRRRSKSPQKGRTDAASLYLNGLSHHDYLDTPSPHKR